MVVLSGCGQELEPNDSKSFYYNTGSRFLTLHMLRIDIFRYNSIEDLLGRRMEVSSNSLYLCSQLFHLESYRWVGTEPQLRFLSY
jgi:hypothetical protein